MNNYNEMFEIETLQDWQLDANLEATEPVDTVGGASNSNSSNNSADQP